jgi:uncharacterized cupredoxin-like copper-binding protein
MLLALFLLLTISMQPVQAQSSEDLPASMNGMDMSSMHGMSTDMKGMDMKDMQHGMMPGMSHAQDSEKHHEIVAGQPGDEQQVDRTIKVSASDNLRFNPDSLTVKQGETIRFTVTNSGQTAHAFVIATPQRQKEYQQMMERMPTMPQEGDNAITVEPGKTRDLIWQFSHPGTVQFACHEPGHYVAGMVGTIKVLKEPQ